MFLPLFFVSDLFAQTAQLFTYVSLTDNDLSSDQLTKRNVFLASPHVSSARYLTIQDIPQIQQNGMISLQVPGSSDTLSFAATYIKSDDTSNYVWRGTIVSPRPCLADSSGIQEDDCIAGSLIIIKKSNSFFGELRVDDDIYHIKDLGNGLNYLTRINRTTFVGDGCATPSVSDGSSNGHSDTLSERGHCPVKVLVLYTQAALDEHSDILNIIDLSIEKTKQILQNSHVPTELLNIILAGTHLLTPTEFEESADLEIDRAGLPSNIPINNNRNQFHADLVIILTQTIYSLNPLGGTLSVAYGGVSGFGDSPSDFNTAFALVEAGAVTGPTYSFSHEFAHLFGCRHNRMPEDCAADGDNSGLPHSHGKYIHKEFFTTLWEKQTVMGACGVTRIENYSNPNVEYKNRSTGNEETNYNAKTLAYAACRVSNYVTTVDYVEPAILLKAPPIICVNYTAWAHVEVEGLASPIYYYWQTSIDGFNYSPNPATASSSSSFMFTTPSSVGQPLWVKVTVASGGMVLTAQAMMMSGYIDGQCSHPKPSSTELIVKDDLFTVYPNPTNHDITITFLNSKDLYYDIEIFDMMGTLIKTSMSSEY